MLGETQFSSSCSITLRRSVQIPTLSPWTGYNRLDSPKAKYQEEEKSEHSILGPLFATYKTEDVVKALFKPFLDRRSTPPRGLIQKLEIQNQKLPLYVLSENDLEQIICQIIVFLGLHLHILGKKSEYRETNLLETSNFTKPEQYIESYAESEPNGVISMYSILFVLKLLTQNHPTLVGRLEERGRANLQTYLQALNL
jgi:hypothetical protein